MASYDYACPACDHAITEKRSINDPESVHMCEKCGYRMIRVYSAPGIQFKGGGFYSTSDRG